MACHPYLRRFPWFMMLLILCIIGFTIGFHEQSNKAYDTSESLISLFNGIDGVLEDLRDAQEPALGVVWGILVTNGIGLLIMTVIMVRSSTRADTVVSEGSVEGMHYGGLSGMFFILLVILSYVAAIMASIIMTLMAAMLAAFYIAKEVGTEALKLYNTVDKTLDLWDTLIASSDGQQATTLLETISTLNTNLSCGVAQICNDKTRASLETLKTVGGELQNASQELSTVSGQFCAAQSDGSGCLGLPIPFFADEGCVCESKLKRVVDLADDGAGYALVALIFSIILFLLWLVYYGRTTSNWRQVKRDNFWSRRAINTSPKHNMMYA